LGRPEEKGVRNFIGLSTRRFFSRREGRRGEEKRQWWGNEDIFALESVVNCIGQKGAKPGANELPGYVACCSRDGGRARGAGVRKSGPSGRAPGG